MIFLSFFIKDIYYGNNSELLLFEFNENVWSRLQYLTITLPTYEQRPSWSGSWNTGQRCLYQPYNISKSACGKFKCVIFHQILQKSNFILACRYFFSNRRFN